ncbi:MAG: hypothetical protein ACRCZP_16110, partial [Phycicoccus sp.]
MVALTKAVLGAALWVVGVSAAGGVLGGLGWWSPGVGWATAVTVAAAAWWLVRPLSDIDGAGAPRARRLRRLARTGHPHQRAVEGGRRRGSRTAAGALVALCVAFTVGAAATRSEQVVVHRDASSNLQAAISLARTGDRVVPVSPEISASGALDVPGVGVGSMAFYEVESRGRPAVQPQFVVGPAVVYGLGWWLGASEPEVALILPAVATGVALLGLGLLVGRLVGAWWGVVAVGVAGVLFPVVHVARATYSEPLALLTLGGGLLAWTVAAGRRRLDGPGEPAGPWPAGERSAAPVEGTAASSGEPAAPGEGPAVPSGRLTTPSGRLTTPSGRLTTPSGRLTTPSGRLT